MGHKATLAKGSVQLISSGTGIRHAEFAAPPEKGRPRTHLLQVRRGDSVSVA